MDIWNRWKDEILFHWDLFKSLKPDDNQSDMEYIIDSLVETNL